MIIRRVKGMGQLTIFSLVFGLLIFTVTLLMIYLSHETISDYALFIAEVVIAWLIMITACLVNYYTYYVVDQNGVTKRFLWFSHTLFWNECCFIKRIRVKPHKAYLDYNVIICSRHALKYDVNDVQLRNYNWPAGTIIIRNATDEIYSEFLRWCGGERDIRS